MRIIFTMILVISTILISGTLEAQITHQVSVTSNVFTPAQLTINTGDKVVWTNTQGTHNVNGTTAKFPSNPASFGNSLGSGWTYEHVFTVAGTYNYQCDPHVGLGMTGVITVNDVSTSIDKNKRADFSFYPNPAGEYLKLVNMTGWSDGSGLEIIDITGKTVYKTIVRDTDLTISLRGLNNGLYFIRISNSETVKTELFVKE